MLPHTAIEAEHGYRVWAATYDDQPNPILALEMRVLTERVGAVAGMRILDAGSGTGRWMEWATARGACVFGMDACSEMVLQAERKPGLRGHSAIADIRSIPFRNDCFDIALCSFTIGYLPSPVRVLGELARVSRQVIVSDLHPEAVRAGWTRSFRAQNRVYELIHYQYSISALDDCAQTAGLSRKWRAEMSFGEPEREVFRRAGKESTFDTVSRIPAVLITVWQR